MGGNSRTTLIINCSPAYYNGSETVSTLRFGVRAKSIKNNAKVNTELPPLELKKLLKQAQSEIVFCKKHIESLELEVSQWRAGIRVDESEWVKLMSLEKIKMPTGINLENSNSSSMSEDERDGFMQRENELSDILSEKECQLKEKDLILDNVNEQLNCILKMKEDLENVSEFILKLGKYLVEGQYFIIRVSN